jgi:DNA polymerase-4
LSGTTVKIKLRWADFTTLTRQVTLDRPIDQDDAIFEAAVDLFRRVWPVGKPVRLIGVGLSGFAAPARQLGLFEDPSTADEKRRLQQTLDALRERYGDDAVRRMSDLSLDDL